MNKRDFNKDQERINDLFSLICRRLLLVDSESFSMMANQPLWSRTLEKYWV